MRIDVPETRLWIDNVRWRGVPFLFRSGKAMAVRAQHVSQQGHIRSLGVADTEIGLAEPLGRTGLAPYATPRRLTPQMTK